MAIAMLCIMIHQHIDMYKDMANRCDIHTYDILRWCVVLALLTSRAVFVRHA